MTESQGHTYVQQHQISGDAVRLDIAAESTSILEEARQGTAGRAARTLIKDGPLRVTIVGFKEGGALQAHRAGGPVSIHVLRGEVEITALGNAENLREGNAIVLRGDVEHSLAAHEESVILLTIAMP